MEATAFAVSTSDFASERRFQKKPDLTALCELPLNLSSSLLELNVALRSANELQQAADAALQLAQVTTSSQQLQVLSRFIGILTDLHLSAASTAISTSPAHPYDAHVRKLVASHFVFPWLLDCRVRYAHKMLIGLAKQQLLSFDDELQRIFETSLLHQDLLLHNTVDSASSTVVVKNTVLHFMNCLDAVTVTTAPVFRRPFEATIVDTLPKLGDALTWALDNAWKHRNLVVVASHQEDIVVADGATTTTGTSGSSAGVFGDDLDIVRFCIRVAATHMHKFMVDWSLRLATSVDQNAKLVGGLSSVVAATATMLSSNLLPKDVLNAAGLLFASVITMQRVDPCLLTAVCAAAASATGKRLPGQSEDEARSSVKGLCCSMVRFLLAALTCPSQSSTDAVVDPSQLRHVLCSMVEYFTANGRFAFFKGLLSHCSKPLFNDVTNLGVLIKEHGDGTSILHDIIVPSAITCTGEVQEPDTRFMAIQTLDAAVRHISSVVEAWIKMYSQSPDTTFATTPVSETVFFCVTPKFRFTVTSTVQVIMSLWDDPTQQVSGPLYDTYGVILSLSQQVTHAFDIIKTQERRGRSRDVDASPVLIRTEDAIRSILATHNDRRGKYHALLALVDTLSVPDLRRSLNLHYGCDEDENDASSNNQGFVHFTTMLISGACNAKICSVCGEVLASVARKLLTTSSSTSAEALSDSMEDQHEEAIWIEVFMMPIARAACGGAASFRGLNVSPAQAASSVIAHMLTPLLKRWTFVALRCVLRAIASCTTTSTEANVCLAIVETLYRARTCGMDCSAYANPNNALVFPVVCVALQSSDCELRNNAFSSCTLSVKGAEPAAPWQMTVVERYVIMNLHLGGDSTARKGFMQSVGKWIKRLVDSTTSSKTRTGVPSDPKAKRKQQQQQQQSSGSPVGGEDSEAKFVEYVHRVFAHVVALVRILCAHAGAAVVASSSSNSNDTRCRPAHRVPDLSVERRFTALALLLEITRAILPVFLGHDAATGPRGGSARHVHTALAASSSHFAGGVRDEDVLHALLPTAFVPVCVESLSEGWDKIRTVAFDMLQQFLKYKETQAIVFSSPFNVTCWNTDSLKAELESPRYRESEGAVRKTLLALNAPWNKQHAAGFYLRSSLTHLRSKCDTLAQLSNDTYDTLRAHPVHGSVSMCGALFGAVATQAGVDKAEVKLLAEDLLDLCVRVIGICTRLVAGVASIDGEEETHHGTFKRSVDCRGHVFFSEGQQQQGGVGDDGVAPPPPSSTNLESESRIVVNNTWLGIRSATTVVEDIFLSVPLDVVAVDRVGLTMKALVNTLLLTKHNGVMSKCRQSLKQMCCTLLRAKMQEYYELPSRILATLMGSEGVTSPDANRVLRRSQGLTHAIMSFLEAEDASVPFVLFPLAMDTLLRTAAADSSDEASLILAHKVNALNVLKFVFDNKVFASRIVPHVQEAFIIASSGFRHTNWAVRNSSLMLFSSVLHRFIGDHPSMGGGGINTSFHDVASRIPRGIHFVLQELSEAVTSAEQTHHVHPALFPTLLMLSMLTPDASHMVTRVASSASSGHKDDSDDLHKAIALVKRTLHINNLMARGASAAALLGLVPIDQVCDVLDSLGDVLFSSHSGLNEIHGALVQSQRIFNHYVGTTTSSDGRGGGSFYVSSHFSDPLAKKVLKQSLLIIAKARERLYAASLQCNTVAELFFSFAADLVYFTVLVHYVPSQQQHVSLGSTDDEVHQSGQEHANGILLRDLAEVVTASAASAAKALVVGAIAPAASSATQKQQTVILADMTSSRDSLARFFVIVALAASKVNFISSASSAFIRQDLAHIVCADEARLDSVHLTKRHNVIVWILHHLCERHGPVSCIMDALPQRRKTCLFTWADAAECSSWISALPALKDTQQLTEHRNAFLVGCALRVGRSLLPSASSSDSGAPMPTKTLAPWSIARHEKLATVMHYLELFGRHTLHQMKELIPLVVEVCEVITYTPARCWATRCIAFLPDAHMFSFLWKHISNAALPSSPVASRMSAVDTIGDAFLAVVGETTSATTNNTTTTSTTQRRVLLPEQRVRLLTILFRLLFDDDDTVRSRSCEVVTQALVGPGKPCLCHVSSVCVLVVALRRIIHDEGRFSETVEVFDETLRDDCAFAVASDEATDEENPTTRTEEQEEEDNAEVDDDDGDDDALFSAESENTFVEAACVAEWIQLILHPTLGTRVADVLQFQSLFENVANPAQMFSSMSS